MAQENNAFAASPEMLSILEHSDRSVLVMDMAYRILWFNAQAASTMSRFFGESVKSGYTYWDYADRGNGKRFMRNFELALKGRRVSVERRLDSKSDDEIWIEAVFSPLRGSDGLVTGVIHSYQDISQRKRREREEQHRENIVRAINSNDSQAFALIDANNIIVSCNRFATLLLGNSGQKRSLEKSNVMECLADTWRERFTGGLKVARSGGTVVIEFELPVKGLNTIEIRFCPVNAKDEASMVSIWAVDISDKKRAEREIRVSEENLRSVFNSSSQTFYLLDHELNILTFNEAAADLAKEQYGRSLKLGINVAEVTPSDRMPQFLAEAKQAFTGNKVQVEKHFSNGNREHWFERHINPIRNKDGVIDRIAIWSIDITNRKRAEMALRENEAKFRQLAAIMPVGIYQTDVNSNTVYVNDSLRKIIPTSVSDLLSGEWKKLIHPDDAELAGMEWQRAAGEQVPYQLNYRLIRPDGKVTHVLEQAVPMFDHHRGYTGHIGSLVDLTVQRANQQLEQEKNIAERSLHFRSDFLASMSHEIRTPLTGMLAISELLLESDLRPDQREQVLHIHNAAEDLRSIVNDVLHLSELEAGKVILKENLFTSTQLLDTVVKRFGPEAKAKDIHLKVNDQSQGASLRSDRRRLTQILSNLVKNAIKFTEKGDVTVLVERSDGHLRLEVHDTGIGIPEHDLPKLFKEFSQLEHTTAQNLEGTGLGLSITKKLTEMLGGSIGVTSRLGVGSVFWVKIPLGVTSASEPNETVNNVPVPPSLPKGRRVLLVEDNIINQHAFKVMLGRMGCEVTAVNNGEQAVNTFEPGRFDLIFMDIQMPVMDGIEASERIRAKGIAPPIIGLSGNVLERDADGKLKVEMDDLLIKPVTSHELQRKLEQWAGNN